MQLHSFIKFIYLSIEVQQPSHITQPVENLVKILHDHERYWMVLPRSRQSLILVGSCKIFNTKHLATCFHHNLVKILLTMVFDLGSYFVIYYHIIIFLINLNRKYQKLNIVIPAYLSLIVT